MDTNTPETHMNNLQSCQRRYAAQTDERERYEEPTEETPARLSVCCDAPVSVKGRTTLHYECNRCRKPCDGEVSE